jgi:formylglycine-generating enzyme required for sulfatase activity
VVALGVFVASHGVLARGLACPAGSVLVVPPAEDPDRPNAVMPDTPFCIDRYEGTLVEILEGGHEQPFSPYASPHEHKVRAISRGGVVPQAYLSRNEAAAACKASKKRLCTEDEWVVACRGKKPTLFPYGKTRHDGYCNDAGDPPLRALFGDLGDGMFAFGPMNDPRLNQQPNTVAKGGSHPRCTNSYGVFDMVGNLHEWVEDPAGTFRGGYYLDTHINGDGCSYRTVAHDATYHDYSTGFRCCADPR